MYRIDRMTIADAFRTMLGIGNIQLADRGAVRFALALYDDGFDFADALHLASTPGGAAFATFDRALRHRAAQITGLPEVMEPT